MKELLDSILLQIATISSFKYVDEDWGQLDEDMPPVKYPMALVDIDVQGWSNLGNLRQTAEVVIGITVVSMRLSNSSKAAPSTQRSNAFEVFDLLDGVQSVLHGWSPAVGNRLMRRSTTRIAITRGLKAYRAEYVCALSDDTAYRRQLTTIQAQPKVTVDNE